MQKIVLFLSIVLLLGLAAMGAYIWQNEQDKATFKQQLTNQQVDTPTASPSPVSTPESITTPDTATQEAQPSNREPNNKTGTITGSLSYPSEVIPDMKVCAVNLTTKSEICTNERIRNDQFLYGVGYELSVPAGNYHVYAQLPNDSYKAYYNQFVVCGLAATCNSRDLIVVSVRPDQTINNINPMDWYNQQPS